MRKGYAYYIYYPNILLFYLALLKYFISTTYYGSPFTFKFKESHFINNK